MTFATPIDCLLWIAYLLCLENDTPRNTSHERQNGTLQLEFSSSRTNLSFNQVSSNLKYCNYKENCIVLDVVCSVIRDAKFLPKCILAVSAVESREKGIIWLANKATMKVLFRFTYTKLPRSFSEVVNSTFEY